MEELIRCAADEVDVSAVPGEIKLLPLGQIHSQKGDFIVDQESFQMIEKQFLERKLDLVIDYEHQTLKDIQAPAGGWIKELRLGSDAVMAKVEWTAKAKEYLANKEYRYLSPVILVRQKDRKVAAIHSAALTNTPAIDGMFAIVNSLDIENHINMEEKTMDLKKVAERLGLPDTATEEEVLKALDKVISEAKEEEKPEPGEIVANSTILGVLGLKDDAKTEDVTASIMKLKAGDPEDKAEILRLKEQLKQNNVESLVKKALKEGKVTKAQEGWAKEYALKDEDGFRKFLEKAPVIVPVEKMELKDAPEDKKVDEDINMEVLKACGISKEDYEKYGGMEDELQ